MHSLTKAVRIVGASVACTLPEVARHWSIAGPAGPAGAPGLTGATGRRGPRGLEGVAGPQGAAGIAGPAGPSSPAGATGLTGPAGPTGRTGAAGLQGPQGKTGATGPAGAAGATGPAGPAGPQGPAGPASAPVRRAPGDFGTVVPASLGVVLDFAGVGVIGAATMSGIGFTVPAIEAPITDVRYLDYSPGQPTFPPVISTGLQGTLAQIAALDRWVLDTVQDLEARKSITIMVVGTDGSTRLSLTLVDCLVIGAQAYAFVPPSNPSRVYGELMVQPERMQLNSLVFKSSLAGAAPRRTLAAAVEGDPALAEAVITGDVVREGGIKSILVNVQRETAFTLTPEKLAGGAVRFSVEDNDPGSTGFSLGKRSIDPLVLSRIVHGNGVKLKEWIGNSAEFLIPSHPMMPSVETVGFDVTDNSVASLTYTDVFLTSVTFIGPESAANFATLDLTLKANRVASP